LANKQGKLSKAAQARINGYEAKASAADGRKALRKKDNLRALVISLVAVTVAVSAQLVYFNLGPGIPKPAPAAPSAPAASIAENREWSGSMDVGSSTLEFKLFGDKAPQAVANFVTLVNKGFYSGVTCHRLTTEGIFVLQCGDPNGDGTGGPGYSFGPIENAPAADLYKTGYLAMARTGGNASSMGSQFFIVYADSTIPADAAGGYTVFGEITKNIEAVQEIAAAGTEDGKGDGKPKNQISLGNLSVK
jgi:peptidyl-prolyl cis-trans isomerase B (cyclophilin B)